MTPADTTVSVAPDHADGLYKVREEIVFKIDARRGDEPVRGQEVQWYYTKNGIRLTAGGTIKLDDKGGAVVRGKLDEPGILQCTASLREGDKDRTGAGGAAVDPQEIRAGQKESDDFDAFWDGKKKQLAASPYKAKLTPISPSRAGTEAFDVEADCPGGKPMTAYYIRPAQAKPKSCPAILIPQAAGVHSCKLEPDIAKWADDGFLVMEVNAHGERNGQSDEYYQRIGKEQLGDYRTRGRDSRETYYFLGMYLRDLRAVDFLTSQPEWDGRVLVAHGGSQGAAQATFLAATDRRVTCLVAVSPAMCDHGGMVAGRAPGWPQLVVVGKDGKPEAASLEASRYYDTANFMARVRVPAFCSLGLIDPVTPPSSVYAAYNNLPVRPPILVNPQGTHASHPSVWQKAHQFVLDQLAAARKGGGQ